MLIVLYFCIKLFLGSIIEIFVMSNSLMPIYFILNRNNYETKKQGHEEIFAICSREYVCCSRSSSRILSWGS